MIFLDAHHFPVGFYNADNTPIRNVHAGLLELVQRELGSHLAPATEFSTGVGTRGPTVQTLLNAGKRLVFSYMDNAIVGGKSLFSPYINWYVYELVYNYIALNFSNSIILLIICMFSFFFVNVTPPTLFCLGDKAARVKTN